MSANIGIKKDSSVELTLDVGSSSVSLDLEGFPVGAWSDGTSLMSISFDLRSEKDRTSLQSLTNHLQHLLITHQEA